MLETLLFDFYYKYPANFCFTLSFLRLQGTFNIDIWKKLVKGTYNREGYIFQIWVTVDHRTLWSFQNLMRGLDIERLLRRFWLFINTIASFFTIFAPFHPLMPKFCCIWMVFIECYWDCRVLKIASFVEGTYNRTRYDFQFWTFFWDCRVLIKETFRIFEKGYL